MARLTDIVYAPAAAGGSGLAPTYNLTPDQAPAPRPIARARQAIGVSPEEAVATTGGDPIAYWAGLRNV